MREVPKDISKAVNKVEEFLEKKGVKVYRINVSTDDEGVLIDVYTNLPSMRKATRMEEEIWKLIPDEEISILIYPGS